MFSSIVLFSILGEGVGPCKGTDFLGPDMGVRILDICGLVNRSSTSDLLTDL